MTRRKTKPGELVPMPNTEQGWIAMRDYVRDAVRNSGLSIKEISIATNGQIGTSQLYEFVRPCGSLGPKGLAAVLRVLIDAGEIAVKDVYFE